MAILAGLAAGMFNSLEYTVKPMVSVKEKFIQLMVNKAYMKSPTKYICGSYINV